MKFIDHEERHFIFILYSARDVMDYAKFILALRDLSPINFVP